MRFDPLNARQFCYRCRRAGQGCYCKDLQVFTPPFDLHLIVHPKESKNLVGSVRIASLSCANTTWIEGTGEDLDFSPEILRTLSDPTLAPMVLYPTTDATPLESISRAEIPAGRRLALFVIDGTWYQAKQMVRRSLLLSTLPKVSFSTTKVSEYGFRKQPAEHCLSSVEAVHLAIDAFQKSPLASTDLDRQHDQMIEIFRRMVRIQQESSIGSRSLRILAHQGSLKKPV